MCTLDVLIKHFSIDWKAFWNEVYWVYEMIREKLFEMNCIECMKLSEKSFLKWSLLSVWNDQRMFGCQSKFVDLIFIIDHTSPNLVHFVIVVGGMFCKYSYSLLYGKTLKVLKDWCNWTRFGIVLLTVTYYSQGTFHEQWLDTYWGIYPPEAVSWMTHNYKRWMVLVGGRRFAGDSTHSNKRKFLFVDVLHIHGMLLMWNIWKNVHRLMYKMKLPRRLFSFESFHCWQFFFPRHFCCELIFACGCSTLLTY